MFLHCMDFWIELAILTLAIAVDSPIATSLKKNINKSFFKHATNM